MSDVVFPDLKGCVINIHRQPEWKTDIKEAWSGVETTIAQRAWPRWRFSLQYDVLVVSDADLDALLAFFNARKGSWDDFLFVDPDYNAVTAQQFSLGDGSTSLFQLCRPIGSWLEPVWAPKSGFKVYKNGVEQIKDQDYTASAAGQIQFTAVPASGAVLTWSGSYYMRCRFADDKADFERICYNLWKTGKIDILSKIYPS